MKDRLEAIIDAIQAVEPSTARILEMLKNMRDDWKEPEMVIECGYIDIDDLPSKEDAEQYPRSTVLDLISGMNDYKLYADDIKVKVILEKEDD